MPKKIKNEDLEQASGGCFGPLNRMSTDGLNSRIESLKKEIASNPSGGSSGVKLSVTPESELAYMEGELKKRQGN